MFTQSWAKCTDTEEVIAVGYRLYSGMLSECHLVFVSTLKEVKPHFYTAGFSCACIKDMVYIHTLI